MGSSRDLFLLNSHIDPYNLQVGEKVRIQYGEHVVKYYTIKPGDTLYRIALIERTNVASLYELNPGIDAHHLKIGSVIRIR